MKVKELIEELKDVSPDAIVVMTVGDEDHNIYSSSDIEIMGKDYDTYVELFMRDDAPQQY